VLQREREVWRTDSGFAANHVIVTAPVGALRADRIRFDPPLPDDVRDALDHLGVGPVTKLFATYDSRWWPTDSRPLRFAGGFALRQAADMTALTGTPCLCWFATGEWAHRIESMSEHQRCQLVDQVARSSGLLDWDR
jgi:monoamine oxidase